MSFYTTGVITNTRAIGTEATNIVISSRNLGSADALVIIEVFGVPITTLTMVPLYVTGFMLPANSADIREFFIAGNVAYEVQFSVDDVLTQVALSSYGIDELGNVVTDSRVLHSELTPTTGLSLPI